MHMIDLYAKAKSIIPNLGLLSYKGHYSSCTEQSGESFSRIVGTSHKLANHASNDLSSIFFAVRTG